MGKHRTSRGAKTQRLEALALAGGVLLACSAPLWADNPAPSAPADTAPASPAPATQAPTPPAAPTPGTLAPAAPAAGAPATPAPRDPNAMTLEQAVAYAVRHNPTVGEAAGLIVQARGLRIQARAARLPQAGVNNYIFRQGPVVPSSIPGGNPAIPPWRYNVGVFVNQVLFDWNQRRNAENAAKHDITAAQYRQEETENNVRLVVGTTFFNILRAQELVIVADERVASTTEQLRVARARFESDVAPRFDVIRSEAELANAQQEQIQAQNEVKLAEATFNTALGRDVNTPVLIAPETKPGKSDFTFDELRSAASANRPSIQAYIEDIRGLEDTVRSRRAENKPQISLSATYDRPNPGGFASTDYHYNLGLVMTWPFFDGFFTRGRVRESQGTLEARKFRLESERQQVELDIKQGQLDVDEALKRVETSRKEQASAREALRVAEVRYKSGVGTNVEVTDAQVAVARAGQDLANAQFDFLNALVRLEFATGSSVAGLTGETPKVVPDSKRTETGKTPGTASPPPRM